MIDSKDLYEKYFSEDMQPFNEWDKNTVEAILDDNNEEYDSELVNDVLAIINEEQKYLDDEAIAEEVPEFKSCLYDYIDGLSSEYHLDDEQIGKVILSMANEYLNEDYY